MGKSKAIGTRGESKVVSFGESYGYGLRRKALTGNKDEGDVEFFRAPRLYKPITIEVKAGKQTANPNRGQLMEWLRQAEVESENSGQLCVLCIVRFQRSIQNADVFLPFEVLPFGDEHDDRDIKRREHMFLDEFFEQYR